jgi:endonuclease G
MQVALELQTLSPFRTPQLTTMLTSLLFVAITLQSAPANPHLEYGTPKYVAGDTTTTLIVRKGYALLHDNSNNIPIWVSWKLTKKDLAPPQVTRVKARFLQDPILAAKGLGATSDYYVGSGFQRGHMAPAADMGRSAGTMKECFYMSNMVPQNGPLNGGKWGQLEATCRKWATKYGAVTMIAGPVPDAFPSGMLGGFYNDFLARGIVAIPHRLFKIVIRKGKNGKVLALGFMMKNEKPGPKEGPTTTWRVSIRAIEKQTGLDFLSHLSKAEQDRIENAVPPKLWP